MSSRVRLYQNACNHASVRHLKWKRKISKGKSKDCGYGPVSLKGGKRVRFCCNSHWMSWVCWSRRRRGPSWCVCVGGSVGRGMAAPTPGISPSASLDSASGSCRAPQQDTCINDATGLEVVRDQCWFPRGLDTHYHQSLWFQTVLLVSFCPYSPSRHHDLPFAMAKPADFRTGQQTFTDN